MNDSLWWYLTRSTGIVAAVLAVMSLAWGLFFSGRTMGKRLKANWWLGLHKWLGGMTLVFVALHMVVSWLDTDQGLRLVDLLVPGGTAGWAIGYGVVAFWLFAVVVLPSVATVRRRIPRTAWHVVHLLAVPAVVLTGIHTALSGTDSPARSFIVGFALLVGFAAFTVTVRVVGISEAKKNPRPARVRVHRDLVDA